MPDDKEKKKKKKKKKTKQGGAKAAQDPADQVVHFDNPLEIQPVEASEDASAQREHGCRPRFPRTWAAWRRDLVKGHMWLSVWFMENEVGLYAQKPQSVSTLARAFAH
jgi:hypothetical protein